MRPPKIISVRPVGLQPCATMFGSRLSNERKSCRHSDTLDYESEQVTERGRWLADLHIDRPLLVGEALESGLFQFTATQTFCRDHGRAHGR